MKYSAGALIALFDLSRDNSISLYKQIYNTLRSVILNNHVVKGARLPSSRTLANELGVSRNTIVLVYEQLQAEGFITSGVGKGTFISTQFNQSQFIKKKFISDKKVRTSKRGQAMLDAYTSEAPSGSPPPFVPGIPALDVFPFRQWQRAVNHAHKIITPSEMNYGPTAGYLPLRKSLASYLAVARGVRCSPEQIFIVNGVQQGLDLICRLLTDPGETIWLEDPGHTGARSAFAAAQLKMKPVSVDQQGLLITVKMQQSKKGSLVYVTPSHQSPTGAIMSLERRIRLLEWARSRNAWIIEDDYDSEFRYRGQPLPALQGLIEDAPVLYLGTFSKVFAPGIRMAYLVIPEFMIETFSHARRAVDTHSPIPLQAAMQVFIDEGYFTTHIRRMRNLYAERQNLLLKATRKYFGNTIHLSSSNSGMHLVGYINQNNDQILSNAACGEGYVVPALSGHYLNKPDRFGLLFGYACVPSADMDAHVKRLAKVLTPMLK